MKNLKYAINFNNRHGFTLIEMAIVLIIFGLLLAMSLAPLSAQRENSARNETQTLLNLANEALMGYAIIHGHLPCADSKKIPDGIEDRKSDASGACVSDAGVLPWNTLGLTHTDAWGHYFAYRVDADFSNNVASFSIANAVGNSGIKIIGENNMALVSTNSRPTAVVLSYGSNGYGAINTTQAAPANRQPAPTSLDELENANLDVTFVSHPPAAKNTNNEFDDMLTWISPKVLINRMILAQRLP